MLKVCVKSDHFKTIVDFVRDCLQWAFKDNFKYDGLNSLSSESGVHPPCQFHINTIFILQVFTSLATFPSAHVYVWTVIACWHIEHPWLVLSVSLQLCKVTVPNTVSYFQFYDLNIGLNIEKIHLILRESLYPPPPAHPDYWLSIWLNGWWKVIQWKM